MFEFLGTLVILLCLYFLIQNGGVKTIWYYYEPGDFKSIWKKKKKK